MLGLTVDTADEPVVDEHERWPHDELRLQFEAINRFDPDEQKTDDERTTPRYG